ncbi:MAG TPA: DUF5916 domain-containing protein [Longimicrobium sp.]|nr:DUF5916 domain-containing protein [Longimicrobium sp.]
MTRAAPALSLPRPALAAALAALLAVPAAAQNGAHAAHPVEPPRVGAVLREGPVSVDGALDEPFWAQAPAATDFRQSDPREGEPATQRTEVRFAYDDAALYVGARMLDSLGGEGVRSRLARRDADAEGDWLELVFDTYHDHSGRTVFRVNPSGVKYDAGQAAPSADPSWDPVWEAEARRDSAGWTAELRIPFSQLRFTRDETQTWGLQVVRYVERLAERSHWAFWTKEEAGGPQRYGHLEGVRILSRPRGWEVLPYTLARASYVAPAQPGSPFHQPRDYDWRVGADVKALLGSNLTLSATVNPDFGQVEVDPAVVNLSAFETFFPERRPFFVEGSGLFGFGSFSCRFCSNVSSMSLFYSRRIGRRPQGLHGWETDFEQVPENTPILAAAKLTGRFAGGVQLGVLDAVTGSEHADYRTGTADFRREVEPLTNYLVARARRTSRSGNHTFGVMATSVARRFDYDSLSYQLPGHAESVGLDWSLAWKERTYTLMGNVAFSNVGGDSLAVVRLQNNSTHYFARPDRGGHGNGLFTDAYDPSLTSLRGHGGYLRVAKEAGAVRWESMVNYRSPGFEVNDMAFLTRADYVWMNTNVWRNWTRPTKYYREIGTVLGGQQQYNFDGDPTDRQVHLSGYVNFRNYWGAGAWVMRRPEVYDDRATRGGPVVRRTGASYFSVWGFTDSRKRVVLSSEPEFGFSDDGGHSAYVNLGMRFKPASNVSLSLSPSLRQSTGRSQYVARFDDPAAAHFAGHRVVFATLDQRTLSMDTRLQVTFTPTLSLELFAQPFVSSGEYYQFKEFDAPRGLAKTEYDAGQLTALRSAAGLDSVYVLDPDRDAATDAFTFRNPDFNLRSLRGNAVVRWEYRPGSTLFFVWQQSRSRRERFGDFDPLRDAEAVFLERPDNVFVVKATYWLGR